MSGTRKGTLLFTVALPIRGDAQWLPTALASLAAQRVPIELAVLDASPDDAVQEVLARAGTVPAYAYHRDDEGQAAAIADGWAHTTGDVVAWLCADDYYFPDTLARVAGAFEANPDVDVVFGHGVHVSPDGAFEMYFPASNADISAIQYGCTICQPACFVRRRALERIGGLETGWHYVMDWALWLKLYAAGCRFLFLDTPLAAVRVRAGTKTRRGGDARRREIDRLLGRAGASRLTRLRAGLAFRKTDALESGARGAMHAAAVWADTVINDGRRIVGRSRTAIRGVETWTGRVERSCTVELPWLHALPPSRVTVVVDGDTPVRASWADGSTDMTRGGVVMCPYRGRTVVGRELTAVVRGLSGGRVCLELVGDAGPWHLWQCRLS